MSAKSENFLFNLRRVVICPTNNALLQLFRYAFVGGCAAVVNIFSLIFLTDICGVYYLAANIPAFLCGLIVNYLLSKWLVFTDAIALARTWEFTAYVAIGVIGLIFDTALLYLFTAGIGWHHIIGKLFSTALVFIWNFGAKKIFYIITVNKERHL